MMTRADIDAFLERHRQSFASGDPARLAGDHAANGTFESPAAGVVHGREAIEDVYAYWLKAFPDLEFTWQTPIVEGDRVALFWYFRGTLTGPFFGHVQPGTRVEFPGAAEYQLSPDGIVTARHVFDFTGSLVTAGALKVKPADN
jgi:predicted ester cyclase